MSILKGELNEELPTHTPTASSESALLEQYLTDVENGLAPLTPGERRAELMELRAHLYALVRANQELTPQLTEEEAARAALAQFGPVVDIAAELVRVNRDQREAPLRQLGLALLTCLVGGSLSYVAFINLMFVQTPAPGVMRLINWPSGLVLVGAPLCLGTIIGRVFPRALHAWLPLVVAAITWFLTSILSGIPRAWQHLFIDSAGFWRLAQERLFSLSTINNLIHSLTLMLSFLVLAWTAQNVARRPKSGRGFWAWCKNFLHHLPDTWVGGIALGMAAGRLLNVITAPLQYLLKTGEASVTQLREPNIPLMLGNLVLMTLQAMIAGGIVGRFLPRRGWMGNLYAMLLALASMFLPYPFGFDLFGFWTRDTRINVKPAAQSYMVLQLLLIWVPALVALLTAYLVGKRRLTVK